VAKARATGLFPSNIYASAVNIATLSVDMKGYSSWRISIEIAGMRMGSMLQAANRVGIMGCRAIMSDSFDAVLE
jgi:hypothetical protein